MTNEATKAAAIALVESTYREMDAYLRSLSAADLDHRVYGEGDGWKVRDMIAHLALWQRVSTLVAKKIAVVDAVPDTADWDIWAGELTPTPELNDRIFREWRDKPVSDALEELREAHAALVAALRPLKPEHIAAGETLPDDLHPYLRAPGVRHVRLHRTHIEAALKETASS